MQIFSSIGYEFRVVFVPFHFLFELRNNLLLLFILAKQLYCFGPFVKSEVYFVLVLILYLIHDFFPFVCFLQKSKFGWL